MSKMQKKVDEGNERINQMSVSESENIQNSREIQRHREKNTNSESGEILG